MEAVPGHDLPLSSRCRLLPPRAEVPTDIVETYGRREVTYSLKTRDLAEAVRRMKAASVETMKKFDDHRRKVATDKAVAERAVVSAPIDPFIAAGEALAANDDGEERVELVAYSTLSRSELNLFAELHRSIRLEEDEDARFNGFKTVRPGPGNDMLLFTADDKRLSGKKRGGLAPTIMGTAKDPTMSAPRRGP